MRKKKIKYQKWWKARKKKADGYLKAMHKKGCFHSYLYLVRYQDSKKVVFYKIGISINPHNRVLREGYNTTLIGLVRLRITDACITESYIVRQMMSKKFIYRPSNKFDGRTECFNLEGYKYIKKYLKEKNMKFINLKMLPN